MAKQLPLDLNVPDRYSRDNFVADATLSAVLDVASRLNAMRLITLPEPDDALLRDILLRLFARRAISPSPDAVDYLMLRIDRSVGAVQKIVTELEYYAGGRAFNRSLARDYFEY